VRPRDCPSTKISAPLGSLVMFVSAVTNANDLFAVSPRLHLDVAAQFPIPVAGDDGVIAGWKIS
jgi:hypothetical protein